MLLFRIGFCFRGEDGKLVVGVRRVRKLPTVASTSVITTESMQIGILASALHAINTGTMFSVYYRPRTSSSEFIVPYHRYMDSANHNYSVGMRFRMTFEGEDGEGERHTGTIIGIEDADPMEWPDSKWKCFKAQWDQPSTILRPDRVCPWDITPFDAVVEPSKLSGAKRHRPCRTSLPPKSFAPHRNGSLKICKEPSPNIQGFFHGQDKIAGVNFVSDQDDNADNHLASQQKRLKIRREILVDQIQNRSSNSDHKKSNKYLNTSLTTGSRTPGNPYLDRYMSIRSVTENCCKVPKLFGIPLIQNSSHCVVPHLATLNELLEHSKTSNHAAHSPSYMLGCDQFSEQSNSSKPSEFSGSGTLNDQSYANHPIPSRSCTKVHKYGSVLGRSVDLSRFSGYDELISELDRMFDFKGRKFCSMVRKIFIYPHEEIDKLKLGC